MRFYFVGLVDAAIRLPVWARRIGCGFCAIAAFYAFPL
jgi:hypothetical protein